MIINRFHPVVGGAEREALCLCRALAKHGVLCFVVTRREKGLKKSENIDGIPVFRLFGAGGGKLSSLAFMVSSFLFLISRRAAYRVIHAHLASSNAVAAVLAGKLLKKKVIVYFGGGRKTGDVETSKKSLLGRIKLNLIRKGGDFFVCPSREIEQELVNSGFSRGRIRLIPNGVDTESFVPADAEGKKELKNRLGLPPVPVAVYVGRLERGKGLDVLLKAWRELLARGRDVRLLIVGEGTLKEELLNLAAVLQIEKNVDFAGRVEEVGGYLRSSDMFILPSFGEGMSVAMLEAMACGLAVISTDIGGTREVIENRRNGILVQAGSMEELCGAIGSVLADGAFACAIGNAARKTVEDKYSIKKIALDYMKLYGETL